MPHGGQRTQKSLGYAIRSQLCATSNGGHDNGCQALLLEQRILGPFRDAPYKGFRTSGALHQASRHAAY